MPVPIPLNECVALSATRLLWATGHTAYGPTRPCVGLLEFDTWQPIHDDGLVLMRTDGTAIARIVPHSTLNLPAARAARLRADQQRHLHRAATDASYAHRWARRFQEANTRLHTES